MGEYSKVNILSKTDWSTGIFTSSCLFCVCLINAGASGGDHSASLASNEITIFLVGGVEGLVFSISEVQPLPNGTVGVN